MAQLAQGCWQRAVLQRMIEGPTPAPTYCLLGKAKSYRGHYVRSFEALCARLSRAGWVIERTPGKRGGEPTAQYLAIPPGR